MRDVVVKVSLVSLGSFSPPSLSLSLLSAIIISLKGKEEGGGSCQDKSSSNRGGGGGRERNLKGGAFPRKLRKRMTYP